MHGRSGASRFAWRYSLQTTPSTTPGVAVTPGAGVEGSYAQLASGANLSQDVYGVLLWVNAGNTTGTERSIMLDIGLDAAGGTSYTAKVNNLLAGQASAAINGGQFFYLPLYIEAGTSVGVRAQSNSASTVRVMAVFYGRPLDPAAVKAAQWCETVGTPSGNGGASFTPGNSGAEGAWVSLGTSVRACWYWLLTVQISNGTTLALMYFIDLAWGDATNKTMIVENMPMLLPGTAEQTTIPLQYPGEGWADVPAGATIYVRGTCSGTAATGFNALALGFGG